MKKIFSVILCAIAALCLCFAFAACGGETKYDVSIKVVNTLGDEFIFTPDVNEISATYEYTGEDVGYYVESYNMPDHPKYGNIWLEPLQQGYDYISMQGVYTAPDGSTTDITANRVTNNMMQRNAVVRKTSCIMRNTELRNLMQRNVAFFLILC